VATELLESEGANVTIASHGAEAVKLLTQGIPPPPFDVVLMDLQMPEMDGFTATTILRAHPLLQQLPIIAMTAHAMSEEVERCLKAGMNDHVAKPIDPEAFFATLTRWTGSCQRPVGDLSTKLTVREGEAIVLEIEGVDVVSGLQRVAGNQRLYRDLLSQFVVRQESAGNRISEALESGDQEQAELLAHSLKGVAGNLGIHPIFTLAGNLENAIGQSSAGIGALIEELRVAMDRQVAAILTALSAISGNESKQVAQRLVNRQEALTAMARLRERLEANAADCPECSQMWPKSSRAWLCLRSLTLSAWQ